MEKETQLCANGQSRWKSKSGDGGRRGAEEQGQPYRLGQQVLQAVDAAVGQRHVQHHGVALIAQADLWHHGRWELKLHCCGARLRRGVWHVLAQHQQPAARIPGFSVVPSTA